ncbi:hypothetical protein AWA2013_31450 (plasmid) [Lactiplantibacillus plantarum]|nr:hypothetical protein AWA2013_31450 [Lactiplantibacillus plantarum]
MVKWWPSGGHLVAKTAKNEQPQGPIETPALRGALAIFNRQSLVSLMLFS